ncbi:MAG: hypothetical protein HRT73_14105 [Flavobacteriales bacterium]|nr:hypothetical protein [Flavobacteriales bacterium]NQX98991.1 hypothetical protein [Flavobacteriales bacterium]
MKHLNVLILLFLPFLLFSQEKNTNKSGDFELGIRSTISTFSSSGNLGYGIGGQFRIRMSNRINTEWFADFITEDIEGLATRNDYHIGWSVMFYLGDPIEKKLSTYIIAGHCFDYTKISETKNSIDIIKPVSRLSSATQFGIGTHFNLSEKLNITLSSQYMIHLGEDIHIENTETGFHVHDEGNNGTVSLEGHILFTLSVNYKIANLW